MEEAKSYVKEEKIELPSELLKNPHKYICDFAEQIYPFTGGIAFKFLSLLPCSLIINDTPFLSKTEKTNMNVLLLTPPGGAKSSLCKQFSRFTYFPLEGRSYTPAEFENKAFQLKSFSLIIEDYATMSSDERTNKVIEGVLGDEKILDRHTTKKDIREDIEAVGLICGVPQDLSGRITSGMLSRVLCVSIFHDDNEHSKIGEHICNNLGKVDHLDEKEKLIKKYYEVLYGIQEGKISGYQKVEKIVIPNELKRKIYEKWDAITKEMRKTIPLNYFRELHDGFRIAINHCFLNYFNRKMESGTLIVNIEDCDIAISLMKISMKNKYRIFLSEKIARSLRTMRELNEVLSNKGLSDDVKKLVPIYTGKKLK